jgi:predicted alpha/beta superfamily hydrolase
LSGGCFEWPPHFIPGKKWPEHLGSTVRETKLRFLPALLALSTLVHGAISSAQPAPAIVTEPATLWYSEQFVLHSRNVGRDFLIQVARPPKAVPGKTPAVFLLDGNASFGLAQPMIGLDDYGGTFEPAFVVGIGYPVKTRAEWEKWRQIDLTHVPLPTRSGQTAAPGSSGGGAAFQKFLTEELRPLIEARYHSDPHRAILAGHSFGGLFVTHVLLNDPGAFDAWLIGSPSIWADPTLLPKAKTFVAPAKTRIFMGVGADETLGYNDEYGMVGNTGRLAALLTGHAANVDLKLAIFPGESHVSSIPVLLEQGFKFLLPPIAK